MKGSRWAALGLVFMLVAGTAACAGGRISLGTGAGACFRDLPAARDAVHGKGKLVGVRRVSTKTMRTRLPHDATLASLPDQELCVFGFRGTYDPGSVTGAHNAKAGKFAIVGVGTKNSTVVSSSVVNNLPTRFRHLR